MNLLDYIGSGDNHFMRLNVSCLLTDFSYFETFWSEFKPENGQLAQNKADSKLTPAVFLLLCIVFVLYLNCICFALELYFHGKNSICVGLHRRFPILSSQFQG